MNCFCKYIIFGALFLLTAPVNAKVTIALVAPKAGDYVQQGIELTKGVKKAVDETNSQGGLLGKKIHLLEVDDECNDAMAISTAQMLAVSKENPINLVIGPYCANSFDTVADVFAQAKIFQIIPTTVNYSQAKTIKRGLVKMLGYTNQQAVDFFKFYNANFAGKKVAVISNATEGDSTQEAEAILKEFAKHGKSVVVKHYTYQMTDKDYDDLAEKIIDEQNQIAFLLGTSKNIRKMARSIREENEDFIIFTNKYRATDEYIRYLDRWAEGTYFMELRGKDDNPEFAETLVKLRLSGLDTEGLSLYGYTAVKLWKELVNRAKSFDYNKLSAALNNKEIKTEFGNKMFHNGAPQTNESYAVYKYEDETFNKVY